MKAKNVLTTNKSTRKGMYVHRIPVISNELIYNPSFFFDMIAGVKLPKIVFTVVESGANHQFYPIYKYNWTHETLSWSKNDFIYASNQQRIAFL